MAARGAEAGRGGRPGEPQRLAGSHAAAGLSAFAADACPAPQGEVTSASTAMSECSMSTGVRSIVERPHGTRASQAAPGPPRRHLRTDADHSNGTAPQLMRNAAVSFKGSGARVGSRSSPRGTQSTSPSRARVSSTRYLFA